VSFKHLENKYSITIHTKLELSSISNISKEVSIVTESSGTIDKKQRSVNFDRLDYKACQWDNLPCFYFDWRAYIALILVYKWELGIIFFSLFKARFGSSRTKISPTLVVI